MGRGRRGAYKAEKRRKELKRIKKQDEKRKRRAAGIAGEEEAGGLTPGTEAPEGSASETTEEQSEPEAEVAGGDSAEAEEKNEGAADA